MTPKSTLLNPEVGSRWRRTADRGWIPEQKPARVMAVAEGYVMARFPNAVPILRTLREWNDTFIEVKEPQA